MIKSMTLREKIGQLIITGFPSAALDETTRGLIREYKIGNIILFSRNVQTPAQLKALCAEIQTEVRAHTGCPAFISVDQEGGAVTRLPAEASNIPGAMAIAAAGKPENAYKAATITAKECKALGINFNLAPVLDINSNKNNPVINVRSYGDKKETVSLYGVQMMKGLQDNGVLSCLKHFPGHGDTDVDSHLGLPVIHKTIAELEENELVPFKTAIAEGAEAVMTAHILFPAVEPENLPATMSARIVQDLLRKKLGFKGLIVSDCLEMNAIKNHFGTANGALAAVKAGVNMVFISHTPAYVMEAVEKLEQAVLSGELPMSVLDESVEKILHYKKKYAQPENTESLTVVGCPEHKEILRQIGQESVCLVRSQEGFTPAADKNTVFIGSYPYVSSLVSDHGTKQLCFPEYMAEKFGAKAVVTEINPTDEQIEELLKKVQDSKTVVFGTYNGIMNQGQLKAVNRLAECGHEVIAAALKIPYDLAGLAPSICGFAVFEYTASAFDSLADILCGKAPVTGRLPITL